MRWFVEVNSIGKTEKQSYCVAADTWQRALQAARTLRSDDGPMTGFSIELLDDGFSAVDPMARLQYFVARAPDDMALTTSADALAGTPTIPTTVKSNAPRPSQSAQPTVGAAGRNKDSVPPVSALRPSGPRPTAAPVKEGTPSASQPPHGSVPPPGGPTVIVAPATMPGVVLVFKREQEPDSRTPLTYREYAYAAPGVTDELIAKAMLLAQFDLVKSALVTSRPGRLVNLAMFDVVFEGRPPVPPLVTLTWKDWKGEPVIEFPRQKRGASTEARPVSGPPPAPAAPPPPPAVVEPPPPSVGLAAPPGPSLASPPSSVPRPVFPSPAPVAPPPPSVVVMPAPIAVPPVAAAPPPPLSAPAPPPAFPAPPAAPPPAGPPPSTAAVAAAAPAHPSSRRTAVATRQTPATGVKRVSSRPNAGVRLRGDELIADLFETIHELHFLNDAIEGANFCLSLALEKMPARAGFVHLYDIDRREFVVTCTRGAGADSFLLERHPESEPLLAPAMRRQRAIVIADASTGDAAEAERYRAVGGAKSVVIAPVMLAGRFLGAIELVNPIDGAPFTDNEGHALTYIGEQYAEFVATRGVLLDPERIAAKISATSDRR